MSVMTDIRAGLVANLQTIDGDQLTSGGLQVLPYMRGNMTPPSVWPIPGATTYDQTFARGLDKEMWRIQAVCGGVLEEGAQILLDELSEPSGPTSIKEAIEQADGTNGRVTLGGVVEDLRVVSSSGYYSLVLDATGRTVGGGMPLLACDWNVEIELRGDA